MLLTDLQDAAVQTLRKSSEDWFGPNFLKFENLSSPWKPPQQGQPSNEQSHLARAEGSDRSGYDFLVHRSVSWYPKVNKQSQAIKDYLRHCKPSSSDNQDICYSKIKNSLGNSFPGLLATSQRARVCRMHMPGALRMFVPQLRWATASKPITARSPYTIRDIRVILLINDVQPVCQNKFLFSTHMTNVMYFHLWAKLQVMLNLRLNPDFEGGLRPAAQSMQSQLAVSWRIASSARSGVMFMQGLGWKLEDASAHLQHPETYHRRRVLSVSRCDVCCQLISATVL